MLTAEALAEREHQRPFAERPQGWDAVGATLRGAFDVSPLGTAVAWASLPQLAPATLAPTASDDERRRFADRLPEAEWAVSDWVRPGLTWEPGMTRSRARFKAQHYDDQRLYDALASDNPVLDALAGALVDPFTYLPVTRVIGFGAKALGFGGKLARLGARVARMGPVARSALHEGVDSALGTAIGEGLVLPMRAELGEEPSFEDYPTRIALDGLFGAALGAGVTVIGGRLRRKAAATARPGQGGRPPAAAPGVPPRIGPDGPPGNGGGVATFADEVSAPEPVTAALPTTSRLEPPSAADDITGDPPVTQIDIRAAQRALSEAAGSIALYGEVRVSKASAARHAEASARTGVAVAPALRHVGPVAAARVKVGSVDGVDGVDRLDLTYDNAPITITEGRRTGKDLSFGPTEADVAEAPGLIADHRQLTVSVDALHSPVSHPLEEAQPSSDSPSALEGAAAVSGGAGIDRSAPATTFADQPEVAPPAADDVPPKVPRPPGPDYGFWPKLRRVYQKAFFAVHPHLYRQVEIHHAVEQKVFKKYGYVLTKAEMHGLANLRGIPRTKAGSDLHRITIAGEWRTFYKTHATATKEQLFAKARDIDRKYGSRFNPPITVED